MPPTPTTPSPYTDRLLPPDGSTADVNPPGFVWAKRDGDDTYTLELRHADGRTVECKALRDPVCALTGTLAPGAWRWRVTARDLNGDVVRESDWRRFEMPLDAPEVRMPTDDELAARLANKRPRIFFPDDGFDRLRERIETDEETAGWWDEVMWRVSLAADVEPFDEPDDWDPDKHENDEWVRIYTPGKRASAAMARFALAWRVTGDDRWLERAKAWALKTAAWNPLGCTRHDNSDGGNDEAAMPILYRMAWTYDWLHDQWTDAERRLILDCLRARGNDVLHVLYRQDYLASPISSHEGRVQGFLGAAGLACYGELDDATTWLKYVLTATLTCYPFWGAADGGWAQGLSYWSAYYYWLAQWGEIAKRALGVDLHQRGWFRNTGFFALYCHPFYAPYGGFGDNAAGKPSLQERIAIDHLARRHRDPHLSWHASHIPTGLDNRAGRLEWHEWQMADVGGLIVSALYDAVPPKGPGDLAPAKHFRDVGWVAAHSRLGDDENDVWAVFKSSPYGSHSHSHADQNAFILGAYGEQLLISAGHYPWYSSPHHWTDGRASRSKCLVLVNGHGQAPRLKESRGDIEYFALEKGVGVPSCEAPEGPAGKGNPTPFSCVVARGEAAWGYNLPMPKDALAAERGLVPDAALEPSVEVLSYKRTLVFVRESDVGPFLVVLDRLRTDQPATFQWLLHALEPFNIDRGLAPSPTPSGEVPVPFTTDSLTAITLTRGRAAMTARVVSDQPLAVSQTDRFLREPEQRRDKSLVTPNHWHLTAEAGSPSTTGFFLAVFIPHKAGTPAPAVEPVPIADARALTLAGLTVAAPLPANTDSRLTVTGKEILANLAILDHDGRLLASAT